MADTVTFLKTTKLLQTFNPSEINILDKFIQIIDFPMDTVIVKQGHPIEGLYIVFEGHTNVTVRLPGDRKIKLAILSSKDFFGDLALISGGMATASITTMEPTRCLLITHSIFNAFLVTERNIAYKLAVAINCQVCSRIEYGIYRIAGFLNDIKEHVDTSHKTPFKEELLSFDVLRKVKLPLSLLNKLAAFHAMSYLQLEKLIPFLKILKLPKNHLIVHENEHIDINTYVIIQGAVGVTAKRQDRVTKLGVLGPGNMIVPQYLPLESSEKAFISATYITREATILFKMEPDQLRSLHRVDLPLYDQWHMAISRSIVGMLQAINKQMIRYQSEFPAESFLTTAKG